MKKLIFSLLFVATAFSALAQTQLTYFMEGSTFRSRYNPAFAPLQGYVNIPIAGGISANIDGNISVSDLLVPTDNGFVTILDGSVSKDRAMKGLSEMNSLSTNSTVNIFGIGMFTKNHKSFWSVDINARVEAGLDVPYSFFDFAKNGTAGTIEDMKLTAEAFMEIGANYSMPILKNLYVGARVKALLGMARAQMNIDRMDMRLQGDIWSASTAATADIYMNGMSAIVDPMGTIESLDTKFNGIAGYGVAIDLGATYNLLDNLQFSLAVNDIGFISWSKSSALNMHTDEELVSFDGFDVTVDENGTTSEEVDFAFNEMNFYMVAPHSMTRMLRATVNAGVEYDVWRHKVGLGLLYHARFGGYKSSHYLSASVNFHPVRWFTLTPSYTFNNNKAHAVGLALNLNPGFINLFVATDMLLTKHTKQWLPYKRERMNVTFGLGVPIGKRSHRIAEYVKEKDKR